MALRDAFDYCVAELRRHDPDRLACALFAPPPRRRALIALLAFHLELARLRDQVREPILGAIRLQWWRDGLDALYAGAPRAQPVAMALADAVAQAAFPRLLLAAMIDGRERDFDPAPLSDLAAVESYARDTAGALGAAMMAALGGDPAAQDQARGAGTAHGLVGLARAAPFHAAQGRWLLPEDLMQRAGLDRAATAAGRVTPALRSVLAAMTARAWAIAPRPGAVTRVFRAALLPAALARAQARRLAAVQHDPLLMPAMTPLARALVLGRAYWLSG